MSDTGDTTEIIEGDRQAIQARQTSGVSHGTKLLGFALAAGFIGMMGYSVVKGEQTAAEEKSADANAAETAEQAAKTVVSDPLGNPVLPAGSGGGASMQGGAQGSSGTAYVAGAAPGTVPPIESDPEFRSGGVEPRVSRVELEQRRRDEARARALARRNEMWQSPIMAVQTSSTRPEQSRFDGGREQPVLTSSSTSSELSDRLKVSDIGVVRANRLPNRNFLIAAGTQIRCVLQTAMDSTLPGFTSCIIPSPVYSDNGRVILLDKGTRVLGEFQGGMQQGQSRIFVVWNRAVTPSGVSIALSSPAADALGRAGMGGQVETFFWKRFGGALLLSLVGDGTSALMDRVSGADQTMRSPNQAAAAAVQNDIRIPPRLRASQGAEMTIFAAQDVDFSRVYSLRLKR